MLEGFNTSGTIIAEHIDEALIINLWLSIVLFFSVVGPMVYLAWKYRASNVKDEDIENVTHSTVLEIIWTTVPTAMMFLFFWYGYTSMVTARTMPAIEDSTVIALEGKKWSWNYTYPANASGHVHKTSELYVPVSENVILDMTAPVDDVLHSYYVPSFRMKEDVVPGRVTKQWFNSSAIGTYDVECAEYCGTNHSYMYSKIHVMSQEDYDTWYNSSDKKPAAFTSDEPLPKGQEVIENNGCNGCHTYDGNPSAGPSFKGMGEKDIRYITEAIREPNKVIADGYAPMMPPTDMSDEDIADVHEFFKSL